MKNTEIPQSFIDYMKGFDYKKIKASNLFDFYNRKEKYVTKQMITKWVSLLANKNGFTLIKTKSSDSRFYDFTKNNNISEENILKLKFNESIFVDENIVKDIKELVRKLKYKSNNRYRFNKFNNETRILRTY